MRKIEVSIPEEVCNYLESLMYETNARKDLIAFCMDKGISGEMFNKYNKEYIELYTQYEIAKNEMADKYIMPNHPNCNWNMNFNKQVAVVEEL